MGRNCLHILHFTCEIHIHTSLQYETLLNLLLMYTCGQFCEQSVVVEVYLHCFLNSSHQFGEIVCDFSCQLHSIRSDTLIICCKLQVS